jgi:Beta-propeller repeat
MNKGLLSLLALFTFASLAAGRVESLQARSPSRHQGHARLLVISHALSFSTFLGGSLGDGVNAMVLDSAGNIYLLGNTNSTDFPTTPGAFQTKLTGNSNAFITKLSADGSRIIYSTFLGGSATEYPKGIAVDSANNVYVTGQTTSKDFPVVNGFQYESHTLPTGFVSKLSSDGSKLVYSTFLGGSSSDSINAVMVDTNNEAVVVGTSTSLDYPLENALQTTCPGCQYGNAVITKFSADGSSLIFSTYFGGTGSDTATGVALDPSNDIYFTGYTEPNFPTTPQAFQTTCTSNIQCAFVSKLDASGQSLMYSGVLDDAFGTAITVNSAGNAFITGYAGTAFPVTSGAFQTVQGGGSSWDAFVTEVDTTGSSLSYSTYLGGNNDDYGWGITLDSSSNVYYAFVHWLAARLRSIGCDKAIVFEERIALRDEIWEVTKKDRHVPGNL